MNPESRTQSQELKVSVCIGTFNREHYIRECLDSVFAQTYRNMEVIVADNASTDKTIAIVGEYGDVRILRREENSGMSSTTRNMAARASTGDYIAFLDSDDSWHPEKIERQVEFMERHPHIPLSHTSCELMDEMSRAYGLRHEGSLPQTGDCFRALLEHCWITISSVMIRRKLYDECGPFNESMPYGRSGEDIEFFLKVSRRYPVGLVEGVCTRYRKSPHGMTFDDWRNTPHALPFYLALMKRQEIWEGQISLSDLKRIVAGHCLDNSTYWRGQHMPLRALWSAWQGFRVCPFSVAVWDAAGRSAIRMLMHTGKQEVVERGDDGYE